MSERLKAKKKGKDNKGNAEAWYWMRRTVGVKLISQPYSVILRSKMNETLDLNITPEDDGNWTFVNGSNDFFLTQNNITYVGYYLHQPSVAAVFIVSYLLIFLVCMVGNGVVCFIVLRSRNMRTVTNLFILNLAISDLLVGIFCMPTTLLDNIITGQCNASNHMQSLHLI